MRPGADLTQPRPPRARARRWPVTAAVVLVGWCLLAWTAFGAMISTAPFFGDTPSRASYLESGMLCLTAVLPVVVLVVLGVLWGCRWGLALLVLPAALLVPLGLSLLGNPGDPSDTGYARAPRAADAFSDLTWLNWGAFLVLLVVVAAVLVVRHRAATGASPATT
jgi:hypothetical protein